MTPAPGTDPLGVTQDHSAVAFDVLVQEITATVGGVRHEARFIVDESLGVVPGGTRPSSVPADAAAAARAMASRRAAGEPLQYVFGHWPFRTLDLRVDDRVLIPRPETEQVVEVALAETHRLLRLRPGADLVAVDAGTGSGAIALALATELGRDALRRVWAIDASADALAVAATNVEACRAGPDGGALSEVVLRRGNWLAALPEDAHGQVDLVVANPPYVAEDEWAALDPEVRAEPRRALVAGPGRRGDAGLCDVEAVLEEARHWLRRPGTVVVELAPHQAGPAQDQARQLGYDEVRVDPDLAGRPRALVARLSGSQ